MESISLLIAAETSSKEGLAVLGLDLRAFLLQLATWLIFYALMRKFVFAKIVKVLDERRATIDKGVDLGHEMEKLKTSFDETMKQEVAKARAEADKILNEAKNASNLIIKEAETVATRKAQKIMEDANLKIEADAEMVRKSLRSEIADLVISTTEKILKNTVDTKINKELVTKALDK